MFRRTCLHKPRPLVHTIVAFFKFKSKHSQSLESPIGTFSNLHTNCCCDSSSLNPLSLDSKENCALQFRILTPFLPIYIPIHVSYHDGFKRVIDLLNAGVGNILILLLQLNVPVLLVRRHGSPPRFDINAENPVAFVRNTKGTASKTRGNV